MMASYHAFFTLFVAVTRVQCIPAENKGKPLEERQTMFETVIIGAITGLTQSTLLGGKTLACDGFFGKGVEYYYYVTEPVANNLRGLACWANHTNLVTWDDATFSAATCLAALRVDKGLTCVSVAGSDCDESYVSSGGRLQNLRQLVIGKGMSDAHKISEGEYAAIEQSMTSLDNLEVDGLGENGPFFFAVMDEGFTSSSAQACFQANFIGGEVAEC